MLCKGIIMPEASNPRLTNRRCPMNATASDQNTPSPRGLWERLRLAGRLLANTVLPQNCVLCSLPSGDAPVCQACAAGLPVLTGQTCPRCALPLEPQGTDLSQTSGPLRCRDCQHHQPRFDTATAVWSYAFPIDSLIRDFKYGHHLYLGAFFGSRLAATLQARWQIAGDGLPDLILPMPLHPSRLKARGFNQAAEIARHTAKALRRPWSADHLLRIHDTPSQAGLGREARWANLRGAFACTRTLHDQHILLIDDVLTTGASLSACADALRYAGVRQIDVAVLARTPES